MPPQTVRRLDDALRALSVGSPALQYIGTRSLPDVTVCEQACLFRDVTLIIGAHGQELVNAVWMRRGSAMLELAGGGGERWWYRQLCRGAGIHYSALPSIDTGTDAFKEAVLAAAQAAAVAITQQNQRL